MADLRELSEAFASPDFGNKYPVQAWQDAMLTVLSPEPIDQSAEFLVSMKIRSMAAVSELYGRLYVDNRMIGNGSLLIFLTYPLTRNHDFYNPLDAQMVSINNAAIGQKHNAVKRFFANLSIVPGVSVRDTDYDRVRSIYVKRQPTEDKVGRNWISGSFGGRHQLAMAASAIELSDFLSANAGITITPVNLDDFMTV